MLLLLWSDASRLLIESIGALDPIALGLAGAALAVDLAAVVAVRLARRTPRSAAEVSYDEAA